MKKYLTKLKKKRRKATHVKFLQNRIMLLHNEIVNDAIGFKMNYNKAKLLKKYNRRLQLITY